MPEESDKRLLKVFLCHASQDKQVIRELCQRLKVEGWIDPWLDEEKLFPGMDWDMEIEKAVASSDAVIVSLSNNSITKEGYVQKELRSVLDLAEYKPDGTIFIIPLRLDDCIIPRRLKNYQYQDYFPSEQLDKAFRRLLDSLKLRANVVGINISEILEDLKKKDEEKAKKLQEILIRREAEEKIRREEEEILRIQAEERARKALERKMRKQANEKLSREKNESEAVEKTNHENAEREKATLGRPEHEAARQQPKETKSPLSPKTMTIGALVGLTGLMIAMIWGSRLVGGTNSPSSISTQIATSTIRTPSATGSPTTSVSSPTVAAQLTITSSAASDNMPVDCFYVFGEGDTLFSIAEKFGIGGNNAYMILTSDGRVPSSPLPGQLLLIPNVERQTCDREGGWPKAIEEAGVPMIFVPEGNFIMGNDNSPPRLPNEEAAHSVFQDNYYIDQYEVTNGFYKACVDADVCIPPISSGPESRPNYYDNSEFDNYPVIYVNWDMAQTYCEWRSARLPTAAEWEKAARGVNGRTYPWGETIDKTYANYDNNVGGTKAVGSYEEGKSPFGVYDMSGNVWEWVSSVDKPDEFNSNDALRGGAWKEDADHLRPTFRAFGIESSSANDSVGFRCVKAVH